MLEKDLIACPACDALYAKEALGKNELILCDRCGSLVDDGWADFRAAFAYALTALILFIVANAFPFITLNLKGESNTISIVSSIQALWQNDLKLLALFISLLIGVVPLWFLLGALWSILSFHYRWRSEMTRHFLHLMARMGQWNMLEVYLVGVLVTLVKIMQMAVVHFKTGFWAFCVLIFFSLLLSHSYDLGDAIFLLNDDDDSHRAEPTQDFLP